MNAPTAHLINATIEWILENNCTPFIYVNAEIDGVRLPFEYVEDGRIVLNIAPDSVNALTVRHNRMTFNTRFSGFSQFIDLPLEAILMVYSKENGQGVVFENGELKEVNYLPSEPSKADTVALHPKKRKPDLRIVK